MKGNLPPAADSSGARRASGNQSSAEAGAFTSSDPSSEPSAPISSIPEDSIPEEAELVIKGSLGRAPTMVGTVATER